MRTPLRILTMMALFGAMASPAASRAAGVVVGNLGQPPVNSFQILANLPSMGFTGVTAAQQFTTGPNPTSIDRVFASLGNFDAGTNGSFALTAQLFADDPTHQIPGASLATFTYNAGSIPTFGFANVEFDTSSIAPFRRDELLVRLGATYTDPHAATTSGA